jgi:hypothetical protein
MTEADYGGPITAGRQRRADNGGVDTTGGSPTCRYSGTAVPAPTSSVPYLNCFASRNVCVPYDDPMSAP